MATKGWPWRHSRYSDAKRRTNEVELLASDDGVPGGQLQTRAVNYGYNLTLVKSDLISTPLCVYLSGLSKSTTVTLVYVCGHMANLAFYV